MANNSVYLASSNRNTHAARPALPRQWTKKVVAAALQVLKCVAVPSMKLRKVELPAGKAAAAGAVAGGRARVLVTVTVLGSAGPLRFLVDEGETVTGLVRAALRCYAREGRMPLLGADPADFLLYTANGRSDALKADERISFNGCRSFLLWQKAARQAAANDAGSEPLSATSSPGRKVSGGWKGGLNKFLLSFSFKV